jgi:GT2 family glycosyltransferase
MTNLAPIALFVYARPDETIKTIESLKNNYLAAESELYIFSDGAKGEKDFNKVSEVRKFINSINSGFKKVDIIEREKNLGLANSVITGVSEILNNYNKIIVIEEDLISSKNFLNFVNDSLVKYENDERVFSVTGYTYNIQIPQNYIYDNYFTPRCESLGWGTWKDRWFKADWNMKDFPSFLSDKKSIMKFSQIGSDLPGMLFKQQLGKVDSWAVRWCYTHFKDNAFCSYPIKSKIVHIGEGGFATHVKKELKFL